MWLVPSCLVGRRHTTRVSMLLFGRSIVSDSVTSWTAAYQDSMSFTISGSLLRLMSVESVMPSNHLILCHLLLLPLIFPSIKVFSGFFPDQSLNTRSLSLLHFTHIHGDAPVVTNNAAVPRITICFIAFLLDTNPEVYIQGKSNFKGILLTPSKCSILKNWLYSPKTPRPRNVWGPGRRKRAVY